MPITMTQEEFRDKWESDENGGGITFDDIAECAKNWGLYSSPRTNPIGDVTYAVLKKAGTNDAELFKPRKED